VRLEHVIVVENLIISNYNKFPTAKTKQLAVFENRVLCVNTDWLKTMLPEIGYPVHPESLAI